MPNWTITRITINHDDGNKLKEFEKLINEWTSKNYMENGFGLQWLGNIVGNSGIGTIDKNLETDLRCRGSITWIECEGNQLLIDTETAWVPMLKMWIKLKELLSIKQFLVLVPMAVTKIFYRQLKFLKDTLFMKMFNY